MFKTLINAFKNKEVRKKMLFTLLILFIYRVGCWIPIPGISIAVSGLGNQDNTFLTLLNGISGSALSNGALLALGISPYINASIIAQLLTVAIPALERWSKQGDEGKRKMAMFTRVLTVILAVIQAVGIVVSLAVGNGETSYIQADIYSIRMPEVVVWFIVGGILVAGAVFTMWLGEKLTDLGIGNGISLIIFVGILSSAGLAMIQNFMEWGVNDYAPWQFLAFLAIVIVIFGLMVFVDGAERKVPVQYAKQIKGRKQYGGQNTHIPIKVNASGVLPIIFATAIISFPQLIMQMIPGATPNWYTQYMGTGTWPYFLITGVLILGFSYFYSMIQFQPDEIARNLQQYGGFIPGIRPGKATSEYLKKVSRRLTLFGAIYLAFVFIVPSVVLSLVNFGANGSASGLTSAFSSTGMLIVVSVALEFQKQLESQLMMRQYRGFLK